MLPYLRAFPPLCSQELLDLECLKCMFKFIHEVNFVDTVLEIPKLLGSFKGAVFKVTV